jgi:NADPH-dependent 2,4-dienoyl-CoA reductase/sulfur reductase-like enzyme
MPDSGCGRNAHSHRDREVNPPLAPEIDTMAADVVVIGSGPAGIAAAACAAERGLRVVLVDRGMQSGGQIWRHLGGARIPRIAREWIDRLDGSGARMANETSIVDVTTSAGRFNLIGESRGHAVRFRASNLVLATGARELFIPFDGWTLPGVMGIGGAQALLKSGASLAGRRVIIAGSGPLMLPVAAAVAGAGAKIVRVLEQASTAAVARFAGGLWRTPEILAQAARYRGRFLTARYSTGTWVTGAYGTEGVDNVTVTNGRREWRESADLLLTGYGLIPNVEIARLMGCETSDGNIVVDETQRTTVSRVLAVGEATGIGGAPLALVEGEIAGLTVASGADAPQSLLRRRAKLQAAARTMSDTFALRAELRSLAHEETIVCRCEDVTYGAVSTYSCARQAKLYTRAGMGPCQGRTCMPGMEFLLAWQSDSVRSPLEPTLVSTLSSEAAEHATSSFLSNSSTGDVYQ